MGRPNSLRLGCAAVGVGENKSAGAKVFRQPFDTKFLVAALALGLSLVLGGGTRSGFLADAALQLSSIPLLLITLACWMGARTQAPVWTTRDRRAVAFALLICVALLAVPLVQLVPLPPNIWPLLPGRAIIVKSYEALNLSLPWRPISTTPRATWLALSSFIPVMAVFLSALQLNAQDRRNLILLIVGFAVFSATLGMFQVMQGPESQLRPFPFTNRTEAVGLFANRNHFAALLYVGLVLLIPWAITAPKQLAKRELREAPVITALALFVALVVLMSGLAMARSRAGLGLGLLGLLAALALPLTLGQDPSKRVSLLMLSAVVAIVASLFPLTRVIERFQDDFALDSRIAYTRNTIDAALSYMPFGSGVGSFVTIYGTVEKPTDVVHSFANRAHNDFLEACLETGALGILLFGMFVVWYLLRTRAILSTSGQVGAPLDRLLKRAAVLAVALLMCHSLLDYPLRTGAIAAIFATCCAFMLPSPSYGRDDSTFAAAEPSRNRQSPLPRPAHSDSIPWDTKDAAPNQMPPPVPWPPTSPPPPPSGGDAAKTWPTDISREPVPTKSDWPDDWRARKEMESPPKLENGVWPDEWRKPEDTARPPPKPPTKSDVQD